MRYVWGSATHQGMVRQNNEDSLFPEKSGQSEGPTVLIVADGMGGHIAGEVASRLAVNAAASSALDPDDRVAAANRAIREEVARQPELEGMGTTMTLVELTTQGRARFAHVGDSRAYLYRGGELRQLTEDHTVAMEYVALGHLSPDEADDHPQSHMLTRCLGLTRFVNVDRIDLELEPDDRLLLCSDGLNSMVPAEGIAKALANRTADEAAWQLVEAANKAGGHDNISVIVIDAVD
ncbi:MAG TPA: PP2C family serine/threonine-protein phosphatase [Acidimicrobiia bacterium]|nr:PP2C family serine/threonine-protein phosphatase [Acidimicrobiia bacterium]